MVNIGLFLQWKEGEFSTKNDHRGRERGFTYALYASSYHLELGDIHLIQVMTAFNFFIQRLLIKRQPHFQGLYLDDFQNGGSSSSVTRRGGMTRHSSRVLRTKLKINFWQLFDNLSAGFFVNKPIKLQVLDVMNVKNLTTPPLPFLHCDWPA